MWSQFALQHMAGLTHGCHAHEPQGKKGKHIVLNCGYVTNYGAIAPRKPGGEAPSTANVTQPGAADLLRHPARLSGALGSGTLEMYRRSGSGDWLVHPCKAPPHGLHVVGIETTAAHRHTAWGH